MFRVLLAALIVCLLIGHARANPGPRTGPSPGEQCRTAIVAAELTHAIPPQLLASIGRVESGRRDPGTGAWGPWPWTINAEGQGAWFESKAEAIAAVQALQARGVRSIDIGCMQVNLMYHPGAFASLDLAFDPAVNADYAARFLVELHTQTGDWTQATANYHSANPMEGGPYAAKVTSVWPEEQRKAGLAPPPFAAGRGGQFAGTMPLSPSRQPPRMSPVVRMMPGPYPGMVPPGMLSPGMLSMGMPRGDSAPEAIAAPRFMPPGMMQAGTPRVPGRLMPSGMMQAGVTTGFGENAMAPGRGLAFYRAAPIATMMPVRLAARMPYRVFVR
jgi:Transglycosylase SLT domain